jgi:hypothetical protein
MAKPDSAGWLPVVRAHRDPGTRGPGRWLPVHGQFRLAARTCCGSPISHTCGPGNGGSTQRARPRLAQTIRLDQPEWATRTKSASIESTNGESAYRDLTWAHTGWPSLGRQCRQPLRDRSRSDSTRASLRGTSMPSNPPCKISEIPQTAEATTGRPALCQCLQARSPRASQRNISS